MSDMRPAKCGKPECLLSDIEIVKLVTDLWYLTLCCGRSLDKQTSGPPATCSYDVLCFGKVLLELVTGNFGISGSNDGTSEEWLVNTLNQINGGGKASVTSIIDPLLLVDEDHQEEVWAAAIIAKACLSAKPSRRPSARHVLRSLESPLRVVRQGSSSRSDSARLRSSSSRSSWQPVFLQGNNHRVQSLDRRHSVRSHGSGGEASFSFSFKRAVRRRRSRWRRRSTRKPLLWSVTGSE
nr:probable LRR receptor-like serine/threonine-protein kinase At2g16250 [Setaria viridis]XP_034576942.1 probable LRR receptor-like serine/threonine-protein kinase At2g16250 [Setaria viridis]